ncbi:MAG TPA: prephenate dehydratase [Dongiaceae bacterium]|nr:prephenate dehydratase [Dongiaceae bacterium]
MTIPANTAAFQGQPGAYSDLACRTALPTYKTLPCPSFEDALQAVRDGNAERAMIPIENSLAGRVADIHHLLPDSGLFIVGEHFQRVSHCLVARRGAVLDDIRQALSHQQALSQCRLRLRSLGIAPVSWADTAGAAAEIARRQDPATAAIASALAAEIYGLDILVRELEDAEHNTTRFVILAREAARGDAIAGPVMTSLVFRLRSVPAALYKALGGFATNGVNITKLESYMDGSFQVAQFYVDIEGSPAQRAMALALEELRFFSHEVRLLGTYPAHAYRARRVTIATTETEEHRP